MLYEVRKKDEKKEEEEKIHLFVTCPRIRTQVLYKKWNVRSKSEFVQEIQWRGIKEALLAWFVLRGRLSLKTEIKRVECGFRVICPRQFSEH